MRTVYTSTLFIFLLFLYILSYTTNNNTNNIKSIQITTVNSPIIEHPSTLNHINMSHVGQPGTRTERTFVAIKPDGVQRGLIGEIINRFERKGFKIVGMKLLVPTKQQAETHYEEHKGKKFFDGLVNFFISGPIVALVLEGNDVIASVRKAMGM